ncbi:MAG TPA: glycosyltransferase family 1 protein [Clostridiaceae bacterium]
MKVAIFTDTFLPQINGVAKTLGKFAEYMDANSIDYRIFAPVVNHEESTEKVKRLISVKFVLYPQIKLSLPNYFYIAKELDAFKPDIIHAGTPFNLGLCGLKYAKSARLPVVTAYDTNFPDYLRYYKLNFLKSTSWKYFKWFHSKCDINYCPSMATLNLLKEKGFKNLDLWGRGIESDNFSPSFRDVELRKSLNVDDKIVFLYVGRISKEKNLDIFMNVARKLNKKYSDKIHFTLVGDGPMMKDLKEEALPNMDFTGFLSGIPLSKRYASSDVFMFTSSTETLGFVILEAMASALPVISCSEGGVAENLVDGFNGIACETRNEEDYYAACERLILDKDYRIELGKNGREHVLKKDWNNTFDTLISSYKELLDKWPEIVSEETSIS